ncbi:DUF5677 domain-containing protein [Conexibacter stalactiti]|uniref:SEC-C metal-binding domain-containing protein n=1 Tax=Conexibacter stalactiti TaxID=1940611 RepID=A0ABU4HSR1_9ACTN|nr:DUF5677 domain-containing protein [Conexibacter stalactiti]MDW5595099.1 SEC-C metal-binding domain-containing protein [Conexibacter stalactiti]MEC5035741.1 DUF5677 domain-containing protein [Conexibacter stalactiti]
MDEIGDDQPTADDGPLTRVGNEVQEFEAALRLRDWVKDLVDGSARTEWTMTPGSLNNVFVGTFGKGTKTYRAGLLLCDRGYGPQAGMLGRSLFEHMVVAWWLLLCVTDESAPMEALRAHQQHSAVLFARAGEHHPEFLGDEKIPTVSDAEAAQLDTRFGRYGARAWHGKDLAGLVREVEAVVRAEYRGRFWSLFRFVNAQNNYILHHSAIGLLDTVQWTDSESAPDVSVGPNRIWRRAMLWSLVQIYGLLVTASLERLSPGRVSDFELFYDEIQVAFFVVTEARARGLGRNDPCLCGSGRKFKVCHLSRVERAGTF